MDKHRAGYPDKPVKTGRRMASDIDSPRDKTVCFMVSEEEKQAIDEVGLAIGRTRSAVLARIVTSFIASATEDPSNNNTWEDLEAFANECRKSLSKSI